jgi:hypothetical protein
MTNSSLDGVKVGGWYKVTLPGETPWAECLAVLPDGSWAGRIDNELVGSASEERRMELAKHFFPAATEPLKKLHDYKLNDIVRFAWLPLEDTDMHRWQPAEWAVGNG